MPYSPSLSFGEYNFVIPHPVLEARSRIYTWGFTRKFDLIRSDPFVETLLINFNIHTRITLTPPTLKCAVKVVLNHADKEKSTMDAAYFYCYSAVTYNMND
ncbi:protein of unknown function [Shewanella benthica]|uniref:Uncharacterized protein n=2 Tax=Shewanella benthica TaxID=43661 RepID=A0A330M0C2_9GAMM|nr:protein of unknown function [Shewanella benthica]